MVRYTQYVRRNNMMRAMSRSVDKLFGAPSGPMCDGSRRHAGGGRRRPRSSRLGAGAVARALGRGEALAVAVGGGEVEGVGGGIGSTSTAVAILARLQGCGGGQRGSRAAAIARRRHWRR
jgi:hypothetical protein